MRWQMVPSFDQSVSDASAKKFHACATQASRSQSQNHTFGEHLFRPSCYKEHPCCRTCICQAGRLPSLEHRRTFLRTLHRCASGGSHVTRRWEARVAESGAELVIRWRALCPLSRLSPSVKSWQTPPSTYRRRAACYEPL